MMIYQYIMYLDCSFSQINIEPISLISRISVTPVSFEVSNFININDFNTELGKMNLKLKIHNASELGPSNSKLDLGDIYQAEEYSYINIDNFKEELEKTKLESKIHNDLELDVSDDKFDLGNIYQSEECSYSDYDELYVFVYPDTDQTLKEKNNSVDNENKEYTEVIFKLFFFQIRVKMKKSDADNLFAGDTTNTDTILTPEVLLEIDDIKGENKIKYKKHVEQENTICYLMGNVFIFLGILEYLGYIDLV